MCLEWHVNQVIIIRILCPSDIKRSILKESSSFPQWHFGRNRIPISLFRFASLAIAVPISLIEIIYGFSIWILTLIPIQSNNWTFTLELPFEPSAGAYKFGRKPSIWLFLTLCSFWAKNICFIFNHGDLDNSSIQRKTIHQILNRKI